MPAHQDIPTRSQVEQLLQSRHPGSVTIYLPTEPDGHRTDAERLELAGLAREAIDGLETQALTKSEVTDIEESLADVIDDDEFWRFQANTLALFASPWGLSTYRLPNRIQTLVHVSDQFYVKPLLRALTFPQEAFILAVAQGSVRLIEASPDLPAHVVRVPELPASVADAVGKSSIADRAPRGAIQGSEGKKQRMRQYARQIDQAIRPTLSGLDVPLVLAGVEPMVSIYRSVNSYPHLAEAVIEGNPETTSDAELAQAVRAILDDIYAGQLSGIRELIEEQGSQGKGVTDLADVARAATIGAVDTLLVDMDAVVNGFVDEMTGAVIEDDSSPGVTDEITRRVLLHSGKVFAVRADDVPGPGPVAALLRFPLT